MSLTRDQVISVPAQARYTVQWALKSAAATSIGGYYAVLTAKVFTAFMFEGVIHHLGQILCSTWDGRKPIKERHKAVRSILKLDNGGEEYQAIKPVIDRIFAFRDLFAHPKEHRQTIEAGQRSELEKTLSSELPEVDLAEAKRDYKKVFDYCEGLLDAAADLVRKSDHGSERARLEADLLRNLLRVTRWNVH
jgi:hypothetical protein